MYKKDIHQKGCIVLFRFTQNKVFKYLLVLWVSEKAEALDYLE